MAQHKIMVIPSTWKRGLSAWLLWKDWPRVVCWLLPLQADCPRLVWPVAGCLFPCGDVKAMASALQEIAAKRISYGRVDERKPRTIYGAFSPKLLPG